MLRSTIFVSLGLLLAVPHVVAASAPASEPLRFASGHGPVEVRIGVIGPELSLTYEFEKPVKSYLNATDPTLSIELDFDSDNDAKTGWSEVTDLRKGSEFMVSVILRMPGAGKSEEALVSWFTKSKWADATTKLAVDGNRIHLLIPLSSLGLRKAQKIRVIAVPPGRDVTSEQTLTLH